MTKSQSAGLALVNVFGCVASAVVSMQFTWNKWWLPLLLVGGVCALLSSLFMEYVQRQLEEGPTRKTVTWVGYGLFFAGLLMAIGAFKL